MPRYSTSKNSSFYHFRVDFYNEEKTEAVRAKYYFTCSDVCKDFNTSAVTVYRMIREPEYKHKTNTLLHNIKIFHDKRPTRLYVSHPSDVAY